MGWLPSASQRTTIANFLHKTVVGGLITFSVVAGSYTTWALVEKRRLNKERQDKYLQGELPEKHSEKK